MTGVFGPDYSDSYDAFYADKDYGAECDLVEGIFKDSATRYGAFSTSAVERAATQSNSLAEATRSLGSTCPEECSNARVDGLPPRA